VSKKEAVQKQSRIGPFFRKDSLQGAEIIVPGQKHEEAD
jgi:hypothetical protein